MKSDLTKASFVLLSRMHSLCKVHIPCRRNETSIPRRISRFSGFVSRVSALHQQRDDRSRTPPTPFPPNSTLPHSHSKYTNPIISRPQLMHLILTRQLLRRRLILPPTKIPLLLRRHRRALRFLHWWRRMTIVISACYTSSCSPCSVCIARLVVL